MGVPENNPPESSKPDELQNKEIRPEDLWNETIDKDVVTMALNVCHETYLGSRPMSDDEWSDGFINGARRCVFGKDAKEGTAGTRCVLLYEEKGHTLYIGFRGSQVG